MPSIEAAPDILAALVTVAGASPGEYLGEQIVHQKDCAVSQGDRTSQAAVILGAIKEALMVDDVDRSPIRPEELAEARRYALVIEWSEEDKKYLVTAPDLPGMITSGHTRAEAAEMGEEATAVWISANRQVGEAIPEPRFTALPAHLRPAYAPAGARRSA